MRVRSTYRRRPNVAAVAVTSLALALAAACTSPDAGGTPDSDDRDQTESSDDASDEDADSPAEDTRDAEDIEPAEISAEVGEFNPEGAFAEESEDYTDEPAPPESVSLVLCNLNSTYFSDLAELGMSDDGENMAFVALSLNDNIQVWESLVGHYPETRQDLERAKQIHNYWREAMAQQEVGNAASADDLYQLAMSEIDEMSDLDMAEQVEC